MDIPARILEFGKVFTFHKDSENEEDKQDVRAISILEGVTIDWGRVSGPPVILCAQSTTSPLSVLKTEMGMVPIVNSLILSQQIESGY